MVQINRLRALGMAVLLGILAPEPADAATLTIRADHWCPYNCDPNAERPGYLVEILREVFEAAGHVIDYQLMPWTRALKEVQQGQHTAVLGASKDDAPDLVFPALPQGLADNSFAVRRGFAFKYQGVTSLEPIRLAAIQDYTYDAGEIYAYIQANAGRRDKVQLGKGTDVVVHNMLKLIAGRADAVIDTSFVLRYAAERMGVTDKIDIIHQGEPIEIFVAFSPTDHHSAEYAQVLDDGIRRLRASGQLNRILARYGLTDWQ